MEQNTKVKFCRIKIRRKYDYPMLLGKLNNCTHCAIMEKRGQNLEVKIKANDKTHFDLLPNRKQH